MKTVRVNASRGYDVIIGRGLLARLGKYTRDTLGATRICIVTDDRVDALYSSRATESLREAGFEVEKFVIAHGEASKSTANLISLLELLGEKHFTRSDALVALGGGVVGDLCGFAAGVYMRGISFVQVPTTLLAAVDSSVGGKCAVDLAAGKNLAGVFHQPSLVLCDVDTLDTLDASLFADGCAEIVKCAIIKGKESFCHISGGIKENIEEIIADCVAQKADIVARDELDRGERMLLNLGHTPAHAIEVLSGFSISHGSAVAIGTVLVTNVAVSMGLCPTEDRDAIIALLSSLGLPTLCPYSATELARVAASDKKREGDSITLILPCGIGNCRQYKIAVSELEEYFSKGL